MDSAILYLQPNNAMAHDFSLECEQKGSFVVKTAGSARESFEIIREKDNDILLLIVDKNILDMSILEYTEYVHDNYPNISMMLMVDMSYAPQMDALANNPSVVKIYLGEVSVTGLIEDASEELDICIRNKKYNDRLKIFKDEEVHLRDTIGTLKEILNKQRYSYIKLHKVMTPILNSVIEIGKSDAENGNRIYGPLYYEYIRESCEKLLRIMTTSILSVDSLGDYIRTELASVWQNEGISDVTLDGVHSCVKGSVERNVLAEIVYCLYMIALRESHRLSAGIIRVESEYTGHRHVEYRFIIENVEFRDEQKVIQKEIDEYVNQAINAFSSSYEIAEEENMIIHRIEFDV